MIALCTVFVLVRSYPIFNIFAVDTTYTWLFPSNTDYTLSDSSLIEISGNAAHLKLQNYVSDANTSLLFHLDENIGTSLTDSSSNANTGTAANTSWTAGNLDKALSFNGTTSYVTVPDSPSLSFSQANTIEAWTKFSSSFSASSHDQRQVVADKGSYQLFYDNETGKVTYELENSSANYWTQVAGNETNSSWDLDGQLAVHSQTYYGSTLYAGLGNGTGDAEVWSWDGTSWTKIGGDGINGSWAALTFESVLSLSNDGTYIYAGLGVTAGDAEVWRYPIAGGTWTKIGGDAINSSWAVATFEGVYSLRYLGSTLYAGLGASANDAEVWSWNGSTWTKIGGDSLNSGWTTNFEWVQSMSDDGTNLFVGLGNSATDAEVWKWNGSAWSKVGGDGVNSSWNTNYETVYSLTYMSGSLYAGLGVTAGDAEVWKYSGSTWTQIGGDGLNSSWNTVYEAVYSLANDGTNIYAGLGNTAGDNEVWKYNGSTWSQIGGDGLNSGISNTHTIVESLLYANSTLYAGNDSGNTGRTGEVWSWNGSTWTRISGNYVNKSWGFRGFQTVETMRKVGDFLYAGMGNTVAGNAVVYMYDGSTWTQVGGQGVNGSWNAETYEAVLSMSAYNGKLEVGLGTTANDAEVWEWNGSTWTQIGGDSLNSGWTANFEEVDSLATYGGYLYAGLGVSANDAEVWRWNGSTWTKIGGDSLNSGWTTNYEKVTSLGIYRGSLVAGLGSSAGDAEVWSWSGSAWTKIGGDGLNSSWNTVFEQVDSLLPFDNKLYAGLGTSTGDAQVWEWNGSTWTQIGGDDIASSWSTGTYERVRSLVGYNGDLYAGIGNSTGDGEVWKWNGTTWSQIGGDSLNSGWNNSIEEITSFSPYKGRLYTGIGNTQNIDASIWSYGNNGYLQTSTASFDTSWRHIAATYDGTTMKIYINGAVDASIPATLTVPDNIHSLYLGSGYAGRESGKSQGSFEGSLDEVRISNIARTSFNLTPYTSDIVTIRADTPQLTSQIKSWSAFNTSETANGGTITYRLSIDGGTVWKYWTGSAWATSSNTTQANDRATINTNISTLAAGPGGIVWQAILDGDGNQLVTLDSVEVVGVADTTAPTNPTTLVALSADGGVPISSDTWYAHTSPYFSWSGADDGTGSGVSGYYVYFGTDDTADPYLAGAFQVSPTYTGVGLVSGSTYYLRIKTKDIAQNVSSTIWDGAVSPDKFSYKYDGTSPSGLTINSPSPAGYAAVDNYTFTWSAATDTASSVNHYEFKTGASTGPYSTYQTTDSLTSQYITAASYQIGENIFYLKAIDNAGNESTAATKSYYYAGSGPTQPQGLTVDPTTNTDCSFTFSWQAPATHSGNLTGSNLSYCYTVNNRPTSGLCNGRFTSDGVLSVPNYCNEDMRNDLNTFYVVARDPANVGSSVNYGAYAEISFTLNTTEPGVPANMEVSDISIKSDELWKLTVSWTEPELNGDRVSSYRIYRSEDDVTFTKIAETSGTAYVDTGLEQQIYYYKVAACDVVQNCGAQTESVGLLPTGKYTDAAVLVSGPTASLITTKKATIKWGTDRGSDSKVQYGTSPGSYFTEEPSNSTQITDHEITLNNLTPGTQYYFKTKWTDEDGNTGKSAEKSFTTEPAPNVKDVSARKVGINTATIQFTSTGATKVKIYYGETSAFGNVKTISTSASETTADVELESLKDDVKHYYKVNAFDSDGVEYEGTTLSFLTLPRPLVKGVRVQQIAGTAQTIVLVSWTSNTPLSSIVTYFPTSNPSDAKDEVGVELVAGEHQIILRGLSPVTAYTLIVSGRDKAGNEARSDRQNFTTATDTRPPKISNVKIEGSTTKVSKGSTQKLAQFVISWTTDEPATSQVEFGEGTGTSYPQKTQEESQYKVNHLVVISNIPPSRVYHMRALSKDSTDNLASSPDLVTISARGSDDALELVTTNLLETFGFLKGVVGQ